MTLRTRKYVGLAAAWGTLLCAWPWLTALPLWGVVLVALAVCGSALFCLSCLYLDVYRQGVRDGRHAQRQ